MKDEAVFCPYCGTTIMPAGQSQSGVEDVLNKNMPIQSQKPVEKINGKRTSKIAIATVIVIVMFAVAGGIIYTQIWRTNKENAANITANIQDFSVHQENEQPIEVLPEQQKKEQSVSEIVKADNEVADKERNAAGETQNEPSPTEVLRQENDQFVEDDVADSDNMSTVNTIPDLADGLIFDDNVSIDVEADVAQIREWYNDTQNRLDTFTYSEYGADLGFYFESGYAVKGVIAAGYNDFGLSRQYFYHDQKLYFAFIFKGSEEYRLYFKDGIVVRYIDNFGNIYDYGNTESGELLADKVVTESDEIYPFNSGN